jgi:Domain of unknown function (DUF4157)
MFGRDQKSDRTGPVPRRRAAERLEPAEGSAGQAGGPPAADLLALQRRVGNSAVTGMVQQIQAEAATQQQAVHDVLRAPGQPLEAGVRAEMEAKMGTSFADVRVHTDAGAHAASKALGAQAYTSGSHIAFQQGHYDPGSASGRRTLAHELTHVVQQRFGPVAGTDNGAGLQVSHPEDRFEKAAEANAERVAREPTGVQRAGADGHRHEPAPPGGTAIQRVLDHNTSAAGINRGGSMQTPAGTTGGRPRVADSWMRTDGHLVGSPVGVDPPGHDYIRQLGLTNFWIRFHLVNQTAGGFGTAGNLVPASKRDNSRWEVQFETPLKNDVNNAKTRPGDQVFFGVEVQYNTPPQGSTAQREAAHYFPTSLTVYHEYFDSATQTWAWRHNGTVFNFVDAQPADPGVATQITTLSMAELKTLVPGYNRWDTDDLAFLHSLGAGRQVQFERIIDQNAVLGPEGAVEAAFQTMPFALPRPNARSAAQAVQQGVTFATRINNPQAILSLSRLIAHGRLKL